MKRTTYKPNTNDPRVLKRIKHAYGYARGVFHETESTTRSQQAINKRFGSSNHPLSKWLRKQLLTCVDHHYSNAAGVSKKYVLNAEGAAHIREVLQGQAAKAFSADELQTLKPYIGNSKRFDEHVVTEFCKREFGDELDSKEFTYEDKSSRLWHPLQSVRKEFKQRILSRSGFKHHYDIQACAPTLLLQHSQHKGNDEYLFAINDYLKNKAAVRQNLACEVEITKDDSKLLINALFCGARLGLNSQFALTEVLHYDAARIVLAKQMTEELRDDIRTMWSYIAPTLTRKKIIDKNGYSRTLPLSSKQKWNRYFELEREVLNAVRAYLRETGNKHFLEHDGWATEQEVDQAALIAYVKKTTGLSIALDYTLIEAAAATQQPEMQSLHPLSRALTDCISTPSASDIVVTEKDDVCTAVPLLSPCVADLQVANFPTAQGPTWLRTYLRL